MSRSGFSKQQQSQLKQLVYQCSFARLPASEISRLAQEKLGMKVTENWVGRIRYSLKNEAEKEYKHLLSDSFAYRYEFLQRIKEVKEIQRRKWEIANKEHLTNEDLIRLKCLTELEESTVLLSDFYQMLPGVDSSFVPKPNEELAEGYTVREKLYESRARSIDASKATYRRYTDMYGCEREVAEHPDFSGGPISPDSEGRYPWDEGYDANSKF
jgi:hypothetical protein